VTPPIVKVGDQYQALRREGKSKPKTRPRGKAVERGGKVPSYDEWTKAELEERANQVGIEGRSEMTKAELVTALRIGS